MRLFDCIKDIYLKNPTNILKAYENNSFEFSHIHLVRYLSYDYNNLNILASLDNNYLYMKTREVVLLMYILIPKGQVPMLKISEKIPCKIPKEWYDKIIKILGWSKREANYNEEITYWVYTGNKNYFNEV